jgi:hypothetical protein
MLHVLLALGLIGSPELYGDNLLYPDQADEMSGGVVSGLFGLQICTQDADDTTPGVGVGYGPLGLGCNIIYTNDSNTGATAITTFDGVPPTVPGTPGSILYVIGPATAANPTTIADAGNFELETAWSAAGSGEETRVLVLGCIVADTFFEVTRHNGARYFDGSVTTAANADIEGYAAIGNGSALSATDALIVDYDMSTATNGTQLTTVGLITVTGGTSSVSTALIAPEGVTFNDGGPGVHPVVASLEVRESVITETVGTCTDSAAIYAPTQATECDNNYGLWVVNDAKIDGTLTSGGTLMAGDLDMDENDIIDTDTMYTQAPTTDAAPAEFDIFGASAYDQSTGGNQAAAGVNVCGGIGVRQISCDDRTLADTDEVALTVNGALTTLVESTDFDCEGEASEEVCCDNLGTAIDGVSGLTTDCATTAGTCYITPADASACTFFMEITDGGVNGAFGTATSGTDGTVSLSATKQDSVVISGRGFDEGPLITIADGTHIQKAAGTIMDLPLDGYLRYQNAAKTATVCLGSTSSRMYVYSSNCSTLARVYGDVGTFVGVTSTAWVAAAAAYDISWTGRTELTSDGDGLLTIEIADNSKGVCVDVSVTDGEIIFYDNDCSTLGDIIAAEFRAQTAKGAKVTILNDVESVTFSGGGGDASKTTTGNPLCDGCYIVGVSSRVTTSGTTCTGYHIGTAADPDLFGADQGVTSTNTSDPTDFTANISNPSLDDTQIVVTGTDGGGNPANCVDLVVRITTSYLQTTADTAN